MVWCRTDPVQEVGALILIAKDAARRVADALARRPALLAGLKGEHGAGWAALFAAPVGADGEIVLPHIPGAIALYCGAGGWWFPIGVRLDMPAHLEAPLIAALAAAHGIVTPAVAIPRFEAGERADAADLYPIVDLRSIDLEEAERAAA